MAAAGAVLRTEAPGGGRIGTADDGLLAPVRAGSPIEAVTDDRAWLQAMLDAEAALARAQARAGAVPAEAARVIGETARAERFGLRALALAAREAGNPVVALVARLTEAVAAVDPAAAEYVHRGCTSQDVMDSAAMLVCARALRTILADVDRIAAGLARLAYQHRDTPMAGRTLAQHAVPTTFGLRAAGWLNGVLDARDRARRLLACGLPAELGGAAGTLAAYLEYARIDGAIPAEAGQDTAGSGAADAGTAESNTAGSNTAESNTAETRYISRLISDFAAELGLAEPVLSWHTLRTPIADLAAALCLLTGALGKFAADVALQSRTEIAELAEPTAAGRGVSSAMPQKRNPVLATLITSAARQVPPLTAGLAQCLVAVDERPTGEWQAEWQALREVLRLSGGAAYCAAELAEGLTVYPERMRANLDATGGLIVTERLAAALAPRLGKVRAKQLLGRISAQVGSSGGGVFERGGLAAALAAEPELAGWATAERLADLLDPARYTGAAGTLVDRVLHRYHHETTGGSPAAARPSTSPS
ncbi:MAG TPA: lyase family protein [Actinocrinis sp.]|nr:lyase family protein [Actinocrinis sp.]